MKISLKKTISIVLASALSISCFCGCGDKKDKDEQGRTILYTSGYPATDGIQKDNYDKRVKEFMEANPDVNVQPQQYTFDLQTFYSKAAAGQIPTELATHFTEIDAGINSGYFADITDALENHDLLQYINPMLEPILARDGRYYGYPSSSYALGIVFSAKLFKEAGLVNPDGSFMIPKTWKELAEYAQIIKEKTGKAGIVMPTLNNTGGWLLTPIAWSYGVDFMEQDKDGKWNATFNTPEMIKALQWVKDLKWKYDAVQSNVLLDLPTARQEVVVSNGGMIISVPGIISTNTTYGIDPNTLGVFAIPAGPKRHVTLLGGTVCVVSASSSEDQVDAALRWIMTIVNPHLTDDVKTNLQRTYDEKIKTGEGIGYYALSNWSSDAEITKYERALIDKNRNIDTKNIEHYNNFIETGMVDGKKVEIQPEEPVCAQELYGILDGVIQEVLTNKDADCKKLIKKACDDFQRDYLDFI